MALALQDFLRSGCSVKDLEDKFQIYATQHKQHPNLILFKYDIMSPFAEEIVKEARGIILDTDNNWSVVNYGMKKFFNHGEGNAATIDWRTARVLEKMDGSLMATLHPQRRLDYCKQRFPRCIR